jgi:hypothetical protein
MGRHLSDGAAGVVRVPVVAALLVPLLCSCGIGPPALREGAGKDPAAVAESTVLLKGRVLARLDAWDVVYPRFSPRGDRLAFAKVVTRDDMETTELALLDLSTLEVRTLLDPAEATRYAAYKAFVFDLAWTDDASVRAAVSDGDVGASYLTFDVKTGRLVGSRYEDDDTVAHLDRALEEIVPDCVRALPALPKEVLESALANGAVLAGPQRVILQKNYAGQDDDIWLVDCAAASMTKLIGLTSEDDDALGGGLTFGPSTLFLMSRKSGSRLMRFKTGRVEALATIAGKESRMRMEIKHAGRDRVYLQVRAQASYESGDNPLFEFDGDRLRRVVDFAELYDFDITRDGGLAAFCAWQGDRRIVEIRRLE